MNTHMVDVKTLSKGALALIVGSMMLVLGFGQAGSAQAFWWWGDWAHGQEPDEMVTVTIHKYIDGKVATAANADDRSFPMTASWNDPEGVGEGSGNYELAPDNTPPYRAETDELNVGASYSTHELLDGDTVGAECTDEDNGRPFALVGYSVGSTLGEAKMADVTESAPSFTNLQEDKVVIVWNESCDGDTNPDPDPGDTSGDLTGEVTGGQDGDPGDLVVTSIDAQDTTAVANGTFADGWKYLFHITVPTDETDLSMKFADWLHENGEDTIPVANNMRISSEQADNDGATVLLTAADTYSSPELHMTEDLDEEEDGLQVQVLVEVAVPSDTANGTYSTTYGVRTLE